MFTTNFPVSAIRAATLTCHFNEADALLDEDRDRPLR